MEKVEIDDLHDAQDISVSSAKKNRLGSIDFVKGFAIIFIVLAHTSIQWFTPEWQFIFGMVFSVLDILGPSLFIFLSALSVIFSIKSKQDKLPEKVIRNRIFMRGIMIMLVGIIGNLLNISVEYPFPWYLWGWNILMFIGFSQIASYYAVKLSKVNRVIIGLIILCVSPGIRNIIYMNRNQNFISWFLHYLITSPAPHVTLLPWLSVCFISSVFGESLYKAMIEGTEVAYQRLFKLLLNWGLILVVFGILTGFMLVDQSDPAFTALYPQITLLHYINLQPYTYFPGLPLFLIRGTFPNMFYNLGAALIIISISFYIIDIKKKRHLFIDMLIFFGNVSLSFYLIHFMFLPLFSAMFPMYYFPFIYIAFMGLMGFLMYLWNKYANGIGTPEWLMGQTGKIGQRKNNN
jgi:uncharacterized membrane protein